jgi:predicted Ser/Thr protein kinase
MAINKKPYIRKDKGFKVDFYSGFVIKKFNQKPEVISVKERNRRFKNCLESYLYFKKINWTWAPELLSYSRKNKWVKIERVKGKSLSDLVLENKFFGGYKKILIKNLSDLNKSLDENKINYLQVTLKDVLVSSKKVYLIDFETCSIEKYEGRLVTDLILSLFSRVWRKRIPVNASTFNLFFCFLYCWFLNPLINFRGLKSWFRQNLY